MMHQVYGVYGASGFGREVMPLVRRLAEAEAVAAGFECVFVDDALVGQVFNGHRVMSYAEFRGLDRKAISVAIAASQVREKLVSQCEADGIPFLSVRSPSAEVLDENVIQPGSILCGFTTVTSNASIGRHFHANIYSYVAHDCVVGDFVTLAPGAKINGNVVLEDHVYVGTGAVIKQGAPGRPTVIGRGAVIGMGAVVTKSVTSGTTVIGNPARPLAPH